MTKKDKASDSSNGFGHNPQPPGDQTFCLPRTANPKKAGLKRGLPSKEKS